jgi:RNA polymerase sigma-70 factor (ECF subfamily)
VTEEDEVRRAIAGDRDAFAALVRRHADRVHDVARRMLRDAHEAEDVVQQAFWNAWRAMARFDPSRPFRHWILRIATNLCRNRWEARRRKPATALDPEAEDPPARGEAPGSTGSDAACVRAALETLPEVYRLAAVLRYVHDLPLEAIAEVTGEPLGTVKVHLHRARSLLRRVLEAGETRPGPGGTTGESGAP